MSIPTPRPSFPPRRPAVEAEKWQAAGMRKQPLPWRPPRAKAPVATKAEIPEEESPKNAELGSHWLEETHEEPQDPETGRTERSREQTTGLVQGPQPGRLDDLSNCLLSGLVRWKSTEPTKKRAKVAPQGLDLEGKPPKFALNNLLGRHLGRPVRREDCTYTMEETESGEILRAYLVVHCLDSLKFASSGPFEGNLEAMNWLATLALEYMTEDMHLLPPSMTALKKKHRLNQNERKRLDADGTTKMIGSHSAVTAQLARRETEKWRNLGWTGLKRS
eukprot:TRINITY_DN54828_c0_g1_i1.p1 TRINITY_DN54828_c0_g1~~TRINITY_DN54828_c0_g1_i1.p1  ORF type:complete len:276 (+),score=53.46 TRINITY_DN54828_c0_g1_i1:46-873(+)